MLVDMHLHECTYSSDSKISLEEIVIHSPKQGTGRCLHHGP